MNTESKLASPVLEGIADAPSADRFVSAVVRAVAVNSTWLMDNFAIDTRGYYLGLENLLSNPDE